MLTGKEERVERKEEEEERGWEVTVEENYQEVPWLVSSPPGTGTKINIDNGLERLEVSKCVSMSFPNSSYTLS